MFSCFCTKKSWIYILFLYIWHTLRHIPPNWLSNKEKCSTPWIFRCVLLEEFHRLYSNAMIIQCRVRLRNPFLNLSLLSKIVKLKLKTIARLCCTTWEPFPANTNFLSDIDWSTVSERLNFFVVVQHEVIVGTNKNVQFSKISFGLMFHSLPTCASWSGIRYEAAIRG